MNRGLPALRRVIGALRRSHDGLLRCCGRRRPAPPFRARGEARRCRSDSPRDRSSPRPCCRCDVVRRGARRRGRVAGVFVVLVWASIAGADAAAAARTARVEDASRAAAEAVLVGAGLRACSPSSHARALIGSAVRRPRCGAPSGSCDSRTSLDHRDVPVSDTDLKAERASHRAPSPCSRTSSGPCSRSVSSVAGPLGR